MQHLRPDLTPGKPVQRLAYLGDYVSYLTTDLFGERPAGSSFDPSLLVGLNLFTLKKVEIIQPRIDANGRE